MTNYYVYPDGTITEEPLSLCRMIILLFKQRAMKKRMKLHL